MFYVFFGFTVIVSIFFIWAGANIYAIFYLTHKAEVILGRIFVLLQKRHDLITEFMNKLVTTDGVLKDAAFRIREVKNLIEVEKVLSKRLLLELEIDENLSVVAKRLNESAMHNIFNLIQETTNNILVQKEKYHKVIARLEKLYAKKVISHLVKAFHIKTLEQL